LAVAEGAQFTMGAEVSCSDGVCGEVTQVVVDPIARSVTHVVVEPKHRQGLGRLVPLSLVEPGGSSQTIRLRCTVADFEGLGKAEETRFLPGVEGYDNYARGEVLAWPYYGANITEPVTYDTLPLGEVAVQRGEPVHATDGDIGQVKGLVIDPATRHVTHVLLQEGHLWGRKEVAIPIGAVATVEDGIRLNITKQDVEDLPGVDVDRAFG
jgi:sporulation protein YlmC with PRC-barrel domain